MSRTFAQTLTVTLGTKKVLLVDNLTGEMFSIDAGLLSTPGKVFAQVVYVNDLPASATIFSLDNPPVTNDNALKNVDNALYVVISADTTKDGQTWTSNGTVYDTYVAPSSTPFNLTGTGTDAGGDKTAAITHGGAVRFANTATGAASTGYAFEFNMNSNAPRMDVVFNGAYVGQFKATATDFMYSANVNNSGRHVWGTKQGGADVNQMILENDGRLWLRNTPLITNAAQILVKDPVTGHVSAQASVSGALARPKVKTVATSAYTITAADEGTAIWINSATAATVTVPSMPAGFVCQVYQKGAGQLTFVNGAGNTLSSASGFKSRVQNSAVGIIFETTALSNITGDSVA